MDLEYLRKENRLLRGLLRDTVTILTKIMERLPDGLNEHENTRKYLETSTKIIKYLDEAERRDGSPLQTPDNRH